MFDIAFLVVLYNKELNESDTLNSLLKSYFEYHRTKLLIWNNGPSSLTSNEVDELRCKGFDVEIIETLENIALSKIYNKFCSMFDAEKYVILDDDTVLNDEYLEEAYKVDEFSLGLPIIYFNNKVVGPTINGHVYEEGYKIKKCDKVFAIGSGLVIGRNILQTIKSYYGCYFDPRFVLYGVDTTFFHRVYKLKLASKISFLPGFKHSLSRLEFESSEINKFRVIERAYAHALIIKYYEKPLWGWKTITKFSIKYFIKLLFFRENDLYLRYFIIAFLKGRHYRNID